MGDARIGIAAQSFNEWVVVRATLAKAKAVLRAAGSLVWWRIWTTHEAEVFANALRKACRRNGGPRVMWVNGDRVVAEGQCNEVKTIGLGHCPDGRLVIARDAIPEPILDFFGSKSVNAYVLLVRSEADNLRRAVLSLLWAKPAAKSLYVTTTGARPMCSVPEALGKTKGLSCFLWRERKMGYWNPWRWAFNAVAEEMKRRGYVGFIDPNTHPPCMCLREKLGESLVGLQCLGFEFCVPARYRYKCPQCGNYRLFIHKPKGEVRCCYCEDGTKMVEA